MPGVLGGFRASRLSGLQSRDYWKRSQARSRRNHQRASRRKPDVLTRNTRRAYASTLANTAAVPLDRGFAVLVSQGSGTDAARQRMRGSDAVRHPEISWLFRRRLRRLLALAAASLAHVVAARGKLRVLHELEPAAHPARALFRFGRLHCRAAPGKNRVARAAQAHFDAERQHE